MIGKYRGLLMRWTGEHDGVGLPGVLAVGLYAPNWRLAHLPRIPGVSPGGRAKKRANIDAINRCALEFSRERFDENAQTAGERPHFAGALIGNALCLGLRPAQL